MSYAVKNVSMNRPIVCTLGDKSTLRLFPEKEVVLKDSQITNYLRSLAVDTKDKLLTIREVADKATKKSATKAD